MPVTVSYPGVYVEEIPSGVRTITGVATSITAFIGRALRGPTDQAVTINSYADFERTFGGLWTGSTLGYAVRDFYLNGGSQAIVVRLFGIAASLGATAKAALGVSGLLLEAANEGTWGANLVATVDQNVSPIVAAQMGVPLFNLTVQDTAPRGVTEQIRNLSVADSARRIDKVLLAESSLVRWQGPWPTTPIPTPAPGTSPAATGGSDGDPLSITEFTGAGPKAGLFALEQADLFNLLCIPPHLASGDIDPSLVTAAAAYCETRRAMFLIDPPSSWVNKDAAKGNSPTTGIAGLHALTTSKNAAVFFPRVMEFDPLQSNQLTEFAPSGAVAGIFARTDTARGVWKAPAGLDANLVGVAQLSVSLTDAENGELNPLGINCLRSFPAAGRVVWGARTLQGDDRLASEWKYIPIRRLALYIEESLYRGTQWVVFEPNDEPLWAQIRLNVGAFLHNLFRQGAFQGKTPREAYFVKCDKETTTQNDVDLGKVNIVVGFAPLKPAEFVILQIQQIAGAIET